MSSTINDTSCCAEAPRHTLSVRIRTRVRELQNRTSNGTVRIGKRHEKFTNNGFQWRRILCTAKIECATVGCYVHREDKHEKRCTPCLLGTADKHMYMDAHGKSKNPKDFTPGRQDFKQATRVLADSVLQTIRAYQAEALCIPQGPAREQFIAAFKDEMKGKMGDEHFEVSHPVVFPEYKVVTNFAAEATYIVRCEDRTILCNHTDDSRKYMNYNNSAVTKARVVNAIFNGYAACGKSTHTAHLVPKKESIFILDLAYMNGTQNRVEAHCEPKRKRSTIRRPMQKMLGALQCVRVCNRGYVIKPTGRKIEGRKLN